MSTNIFDTVLQMIEDRVERADVVCDTYLSNNSQEYREIQDKILELSRVPEIENFFTEDIDLVLTGEQHNKILEMIDLYNRIFTLESYFCYLCGYKDCFSIVMTMENMQDGPNN